MSCSATPASSRGHSPSRVHAAEAQKGGLSRGDQAPRRQEATPSADPLRSSGSAQDLASQGAKVTRFGQVPAQSIS